MALKRLLITICICIFYQSLFAQNSDAIAAELNKLFKSLPEYDFNNPQAELAETIDSLIDSRMSFYIKTAPLELAKAFSKLGAVSSDDGMLSILSWDNTLSGTQHTYANIFLYKADGQLNYINSDTLTQHQFDEISLLL